MLRKNQPGRVRLRREVALQLRKQALITLSAAITEVRQDKELTKKEQEKKLKPLRKRRGICANEISILEARI